jgi:hypothetical protein
MQHEQPDKNRRKEFYLSIKAGTSALIEDQYPVPPLYMNATFIKDYNEADFTDLEPKDRAALTIWVEQFRSDVLLTCGTTTSKEAAFEANGRGYEALWKIRKLLEPR